MWGKREGGRGAGGLPSGSRRGTPWRATLLVGILGAIALAVPFATASGQPVSGPVGPAIAVDPAGESDPPTDDPTGKPTDEPNAEPTYDPNAEPTYDPDATPSDYPSKSPDATPSDYPSKSPDATPSDYPSKSPDPEPSTEPPVTEPPTEPPVTEPPTEPPTPTPPVETPTATPTASPTPTETAGPRTPAAETPEPPTSEPATPSPTGTPAPTATPTAAPAAVPPREPPRIGPGSIPASVPRPSALVTDSEVVGQSLLLAALLLFFLAFAAQLFNSTLDANYDEIVGWFGFGVGGGRRVRSWVARFWASTAGVAAFVVLSAGVAGFLDPSYAIEPGSVPTFLGLLAGILLVGLAYEYPMRVLHRRGTRDPGRLRVVPGSLLVGMLCVLISRLTEFQPGYLYGLIFGFAFAVDVGERRTGRNSAIAFTVVLAASVTAWLTLGLLRADGPPVGGIETVVETALATVVIAGVEGLMFGLLPLRWLPGSSVFRWRRSVWFVLSVVALFAFLHILVNPGSGYLSDSGRTSLVTAVALFALFGGFSIAFWSYFRFRRPRPATAA